MPPSPIRQSCAEQDMPAIIASLRSGLVRNCENPLSCSFSCDHLHQTAPDVIMLTLHPSRAETDGVDSALQWGASGTRACTTRRCVPLLLIVSRESDPPAKVKQEACPTLSYLAILRCRCQCDMCRALLTACRDQELDPEAPDGANQAPVGGGKCDRGRHVAGEEAGVLHRVSPCARQDGSDALGGGQPRHVPLRGHQGARVAPTAPPRHLRVLGRRHRGCYSGRADKR